MVTPEVVKFGLGSKDEQLLSAEEGQWSFSQVACSPICWLHLVSSIASACLGRTAFCQDSILFTMVG